CPRQTEDHQDRQDQHADHAIDQDRKSCGLPAALVAPEQPYANRVAAVRRGQGLIEKCRDESVAECTGQREKRVTRSLAMMDNFLPPQRAHHRLPDKNQNSSRQPNIVKAIETLTDEVEIYPREREIQQDARDGCLQDKCKHVAHRSRSYGSQRAFVASKTVASGDGRHTEVVNPFVSMLIA